MELTQSGRQVATQLGSQENLGAIDEAKLAALAAAQTGRYTTADDLAEAVATEEIDSDMFSSLIETYVSQGLLTTGGGMSPTPSSEGQASNCSVCGSGMINQGQPGDTDMCISCYKDLNKGDISLEDDEFSKQLSGNIEAQTGDFSFDMSDAFAGIELKQGEISI